MSRSRCRCVTHASRPVQPSQDVSGGHPSRPREYCRLPPGRADLEGTSQGAPDGPPCPAHIASWRGWYTPREDRSIPYNQTDRSFYVNHLMTRCQPWSVPSLRGRQQSAAGHDCMCGALKYLLKLSEAGFEAPHYFANRWKNSRNIMPYHENE